MKPDDRAKLRRILSSFDEAGLVALANKGLVRRATKDLEAGGLQVEETDTAVLVRGPDWTVTMPPDGPAKATDTTKATGVSRQILMATIWLRDQWAKEESTPCEPAGTEDGSSAAQFAAPPGTDPREVEELQQALLALTVDDLQKWAGKTLLKETLPLLTPPPGLEVETHAGLTLRLVRHDVEARVLPAARGKSAAKLLDDILTTAPKAQRKRWVLATVLAFQQSRGLAPQLEAADTAVPEGTPLSRRQVLDSTLELLEGMAATGLAHPSDRMVQRLFTLSVSATAVQLPRLARLLRALSDDVTHALDRHAAADTASFLDRLCLTFALARALREAGDRPPRGLVGFQRTEYDPAGDLALAGVGAYPWRTASGYEGLTVLFWDAAGKRFLTWTTSRPVSGGGRFSMDNAYRVESVWSGGGSPERLSRTCFTLRQARANAAGRLSASQQSSVSGGTPTEPEQLDFAGRCFSDWRALAGYAATTYPLGLAETNPLDRIVVLRPAAWGDRHFDELQQCLCWPLADEAGQTLLLTLPWTGVNESATEFLEAVNPDRDRLLDVVARIVPGEGGLRVEPLSLLSRGTPQGHHVLNPAFDRRLLESRQSGLLEKLRKKYGRDKVATTLTADDDFDELGDNRSPTAALPPGLRTRLTEVEQAVLRAAESGLLRLTEGGRARLGQTAAALERGGLPELARAVEPFVAESATPADVLRAAYLCRLHRQAVALQVGSAAIGG